MPQVNTGIPYELFVKKVYEALQRTKDLPHHRNIDIRHNVKIVDQGGIERQFDLYWEREEFGTLKKSMIECKDYQNGVSIERVDALIGKMIDFPDITPILATSVRSKRCSSESKESSYRNNGCPRRGFGKGLEG